MLNNEVLDQLSFACKQSNDLYAQGGLIYKYSFGYNQAHKTIESSTLSNFNQGYLFSNHELAILYELFERSMFNAFPETISPNTAEFVDKFASLLSNNFSNMGHCIIESENDDLCMAVTILFVKNNDYHSLDLFWSID